MRPVRISPGNVSRRGFLAAGAAMATTLPALARELQPPPMDQRMNLADPGAAAALQSYKRAITAMLALPPTDPRNWYRLAFTHLLDCPHRNWWFLPWHRGYLGYFEQTCRQMSGDMNFALPYWDWTTQPQIPSSFADDSILNPTNSAFINGPDAFRAAFEGPVNAYYAGLNPAQLAQLQIRGYGSAADFWNNLPTIWPLSQARQPDFGPEVLTAVSLPTIESALAPSTFVPFGSLEATAHSEQVGEGVLESQPHDNIHGAVGGFMGAFFSPFDPIFYMHHSNIDRLWDVWTRKQAQANQPTLPVNNLAAWKSEPFLFFITAQGQPAPLTSAGDFATIGGFNYTYQPGSGEEVVPTGPNLPRNINIAARMSREMLSFDEPMIASADVPNAISQAVGPRGQAGAQLYAKIELKPPSNGVGIRFHVLVNPPVGPIHVQYSDPCFAGTISLFGNHSQAQGHMGGVVSYLVPLNNAIRRLRAAGRIKADEPLKIQVVPDTSAVTLKTFQVPISSVSIVSA